MFCIIILTVELKAIFIVAHFVGILISLFAVIFTDSVLLRGIKARNFDLQMISSIVHGSNIVWVGILVIVLSGSGIFLTDSARYLHASKFLAKMTIVAVLIINGVVFHRKHIPLLKKTTGQNLLGSSDFMKGSSSLFTAGAISIVSWLSAFILGSLPSLPYPYWQIVFIYLLALILAVVLAQFSRKRFLR